MLPMICFSVEYRKLTDEMRVIHSELMEKYPGRFLGFSTVSEQLEKIISSKWSDLRMYSGSELIELIARNYAHAACKNTEESESALVTRLLEKVWASQ